MSFTDNGAPFSEMSIEELVKLVQGDDEISARDAFRCIYSLYRKALYAHLRQRMNNYHPLVEVQDVHSEAMTKAWKYLRENKNLQPPDHFDRWLFRIATNCLTDHWRRQGKHRLFLPLPGDDLDESEQGIAPLASKWLGPEESACDKERVLEIARVALESLRPHERLYFLDYVQLGYSGVEIAQLYGVNVNCVYEAIKKARERLRVRFPYVERYIKKRNKTQIKEM